VNCLTEKESGNRKQEKRFKKKEKREKTVHLPVGK